MNKIIINKVPMLARAGIDIKKVVTISLKDLALFTNFNNLAIRKDLKIKAV